MKNRIIGFMFVACALFGFNNYGTAQEFAPRVTYSYSSPMSGTPTYAVPIVTQRPTPVRNFFNGAGQAIQNAAQPRYIPGPTARYATQQPRYQQVTETRYRKVCHGRAGCTYEPYQYTYLRQVQ